METETGINGELWRALGTLVPTAARSPHKSPFRHERILPRNDQQSIRECASGLILPRRLVIWAQRKCEHEHRLEAVCAASRRRLGPDEVWEDGDSSGLWDLL